MLPVACGLQDVFRVIEPFQRGSGNDPLTVARHVEDLHQVIVSQCGDERPALVGHSCQAHMPNMIETKPPKLVEKALGKRMA